MTSFQACRGAAAGLYGCQRPHWSAASPPASLCGGRGPALLPGSGATSRRSSSLRPRWRRLARRGRRLSRRSLARLEIKPNHDLLAAFQLSLHQRASSPPDFKHGKRRRGRGPAWALQDAGMRVSPPPHLLLHLMHFKSVCISSVC